MNTRKLIPYFVGSMFIISLLACASTPAAPTSEPTPIPTSVPSPTTEAPSGEPTGAAAGSYVPVSPEVCQIIQELASQSTGLTFSMEASASFTDSLKGETGQGCTLTATASGAQLTDPGSVMRNLVNGMLGWTEQTSYQADGPTGSATAMTRDMALMLILVEWKPSPDVQCPQDQPISACDIKPEQMLYTVQIQTAMK